MSEEEIQQPVEAEAPVEEPPKEEPAPEEPPKEEAPKQEAPACSAGSCGSCECPCGQIAAICANDKLLNAFQQIYMWRKENIVKSVVWFVCLNIFFFLTVKLHIPFLSLVCYFLCISILIGSILYFGNKYVVKSDKANPFEGLDLSAVSLDPATFSDSANTISQLVQAFIKLYFFLFTWTCWIRSLIVMIVTFILGKWIFQKMGFLAFLWIMTIFIFTWPVFYEWQHELVDKVWGQIKDACAKGYETAKAKAQEAMNKKKTE